MLYTIRQSFSLVVTNGTTKDFYIRLPFSCRSIAVAVKPSNTPVAQSFLLFPTNQETVTVAGGQGRNVTQAINGSSVQSGQALTDGNNFLFNRLSANAGANTTYTIYYVFQCDI